MFCSHRVRNIKMADGSKKGSTKRRGTPGEPLAEELSCGLR